MINVKIAARSKNTRGPAIASPLRSALGLRARKIVQYAVVIVGAILVWQLASLLTIPLFLPSPLRVLDAAYAMGKSGELWQDIGATYQRTLLGWIIGVGGAIPLGILAARSAMLRFLAEPFVGFFRFIPPIAFVTLAILWFGIGEAGKISLIIYSSFFTVFLNAMAGGGSVEKDQIRGAQALGASSARVLWSVVVPAAIPQIITGCRVALGIAFMTVIAAELVAAQTGVGYLIWNARAFGQTEAAFVGIVVLGIMGLVADGVFRLLVRTLLYRYVHHVIGSV